LSLLSSCSHCGKEMGDCDVYCPMCGNRNQPHRALLNKSDRKLQNKSESSVTQNACIFIGHGRSVLWARLQLLLEKDLGIETINYESESRVGDSIIPILEKMLNQVTFAVIVLTAEDETRDGEKRARQNVIHELGLFQGKLDFKRVILLIEEGVEQFTNIAGLQYISFNSNKIEQTFYELQRVLKREGLIG
jgi:predicted nucleotide-binding protein